MKQLLRLIIFFILTSYASALNNLTQYGITWTFNGDIHTNTSEPYQYGTYANGDYWIRLVAGGDVTITDITPNSTDVEGRIRSGSMLDPLPIILPGAAEADRQGFDTLMGTAQNPTYVIYNEANNVARSGDAPIDAGTPLVISPTASLVSSISLDALAPSPNQKTIIDTYAVLTVVSSAPAANAFRPSYSGVGDKTITFNKSDMDYSVLANLSIDGFSEVISWETAEQWFERSWIDFHGGDRGEHSKGLQNTPWYGGVMAREIGDAVMMLNLRHDPCDFTNNGLKETLFIALVQLGIDNFGVVSSEAGRVMWVPNGGIDIGRKLPIVFAGKVLNDDDMLNMTLWLDDNDNGIHFQEDLQYFYVLQSDIDETKAGMECSNQVLEQYDSSFLGLPEYGERHWGEASWSGGYIRTLNDNSFFGPDPGCCYRHTNACRLMGNTLAVYVMGLEDNWQRTVFLEYVDRWWAYFDENEDGDGEIGNQKPTDFVRELWEAYRGNYGPVWPNVDGFNFWCWYCGIYNFSDETVEGFRGAFSF